MFEPNDPNWAFTVGTLGQYIYDTLVILVKFELDTSEQTNNLIMNILKYCGIIIR